MKILNVIFGLCWTILHLGLRFCNFIGSSFVNFAEDVEIPIMEILSNYLNFSTHTLKTILGFIIVYVFYIVAEGIRDRYERAKLTAKMKKYRTSYGGGRRSNYYNRRNEGELLFEDMDESHRRAHAQAVADLQRAMADHAHAMETHGDFVSEREQEIFINESASHCMDDSHNAATPSDFGGDSQSIFDHHNHSGGFDNMGGGGCGGFGGF